MALTEPRSLPEVFLSCHTPSVGATPIVARVVAPFRGRIKRVYSVINAAIATADATVTVAINGTTVTGGTMTITQSGSAAGDVDTADPTALNKIVEGDSISFTPAGATGAAVSATFMAFIIRE